MLAIARSLVDVDCVQVQVVGSNLRGTFERKCLMFAGKEIIQTDCVFRDGWEGRTIEVANGW